MCAVRSLSENHPAFHGGLRVGLWLVDVWNVQLSSVSAVLIRHLLGLKGLPECRPFVEDVSHHKQGGGGKGDANQGSGDNVIRVVIVVTDPGEADPESKAYHPKLEERTKHLEHSIGGGQGLVVSREREVAEAGLQVDDQVGGAVEREGGVTRKKREPRFMELFLRCLPIQESLAHSLLLFHNEPVIVPFVLAEPVCSVIWLAKGQIVRSESPNGVLGNLRKKKTSTGTKGKEAIVAVEFNCQPWRVLAIWDWGRSSSSLEHYRA